MADSTRTQQAGTGGEPGASKGRNMKGFRRSMCLMALVPALAACGDATGSSNLSPVDVAGLYEICTLTFTPDNPTQPPVDIRARAFETTDSRIQLPHLALDVDRTSGLIFTRKDQFVRQEIRGTYDLSESGVILRLSKSADPASYLLPEMLRLDFQPSPLQLSTDGVGYSAAREDYARLAGIPETGLAEKIPGHLVARAESESCN